MKPYKAMAHIHSLNGEMREITALENKDGTNFIVDYGGMKCTAVFKAIPHNVIKREALKILIKKQAAFRSNSETYCKKRQRIYLQNLPLIATYVIVRYCLNWFNCQFYADDIYGIIKERGIL